MTSISRMAGAVAVAVVVVLTVPAYTQVPATFVLRSGERVSGSLIDYNAQGISTQVGGQRRVFRLGDLAVIDFTDAKSYPTQEVDRAGNGSHLLVLRDGSIIEGRLYDMGRKNPLRISFEHGGGTRDYSSDQVARIYFAKPGGGSSGGGGGSLQPATGQIRVPATSDWVPTGRFVRQGEQIAIRTTGEVRMSSDATDKATPGGSVKGRYAAGSPLPSALAGALIGRVGNSAPFGIGNQSSFSAPASGMLFLRVNDDHVADNAGEFGVELPLR